MVTNLGSFVYDQARKQFCTQNTSNLNTPMQKQSFTLVIAGVTELTPELADTVFEAFDGAVELELCGDVATGAVAGSAPTLRDAVQQALHKLENCAFGRVQRVEAADASTIVDINTALAATQA